MITSASNGKVKYLQALTSRASFRRKEGKFVAEGIKMFEEADEKDVLEVYVKEGVFNSFDTDTRYKLAKIGYEVLSEAVFKKVSDTVTPQGILTVLKIREYGEEVLFEEDDPLVMILENIQDPGNIGTIIRTAEGAGVNAIVMTKDCVDIYNPKVIRSTMGSIFRKKFLYTEDIGVLIENLKKKGINVYACALSKDSKAYDEYDYKKGTAFVIGNEGNGLKKETIEACTNVCYIPMSGKVESLNASVAASLVMYEAYRQRRR
ncbi:MAG: RNA methyltransferase [Lachnospiraceae bacterium]|nr:RNA methyltransferase [Lachnospiraceae bacterium]